MWSKLEALEVVRTTEIHAEYDTYQQDQPFNFIAHDSQFIGRCSGRVEQTLGTVSFYFANPAKAATLLRGLVRTSDWLQALTNASIVHD